MEFDGKIEHAHEQRRYEQYVCPPFLAIPFAYSLHDVPSMQNSTGFTMCWSSERFKANTRQACYGSCCVIKGKGKVGQPIAPFPFSPPLLMGKPQVVWVEDVYREVK